MASVCVFFPPKGRGQKEQRVSEDEMVGWHHVCNGHELGQTSGDDEGQGGRACCSLWVHIDSYTTGRLNNNVSLRSPLLLAVFWKFRLHVTSAHHRFSNLLYFFFFLFFFYMDSPIMDGTHTPCSGSMES